VTQDRPGRAASKLPSKSLLRPLCRFVPTGLTPFRRWHLPLTPRDSRLATSRSQFALPFAISATRSRFVTLVQARARSQPQGSDGFGMGVTSPAVEPAVRELAGDLASARLRATTSGNSARCEVWYRTTTVLCSQTRLAPPSSSTCQRPRRSQWKSVRRVHLGGEAELRSHRAMRLDAAAA